MSNFLIERRTEEIRGGAGHLLRTDTWWEVTLEAQDGYDKVKVFGTHEEATAWLEDQDLEPKALCHERRHQMSKRFCVWVDIEPSDNVIHDGDRWFVFGNSTASAQQTLGEGWEPVWFANETPATFRAGKS